MPVLAETVFNGKGEMISQRILEENYMTQSEFDEKICAALFGKSLEAVAQDIILAHKRATAKKP